VLLGIQPKNEIELKEMAEILNELNVYMLMWLYTSVQKHGEKEHYVKPIAWLDFVLSR